MPQTILVARNGRGRLTITLNRPDRGNAFDQTMLDELGAAMAEAAADARVRLVVIAAAGRHFCTGADMRARGAGAPAGLTLNEVLALIDGCPKPVIGVVEGGCLGGGLGLAACCDLLLGATTAFFSVPELRVGVAPSAELTGLLMRAMGSRALRRYGLTGERLSAEDALRLGLLHEIVASEALANRLEAIEDNILLNAPEATGEFKATMAGLSLPARAQLFPQGGTPRRGLERSAEAAEGIAAFKEKRKPAWYPAAD